MDRLTAEDFQPGPHASADSLASYVLGAMSEGEAEKVEAHVYGCDACSEALAREARLERAFELLAEDMVPEPTVVAVPARILGRGRWGGVVGAVAIAASALLWLGPGRGGSWPTTELGAPHAGHTGHVAYGSGRVDLDAPDARATESSPDDADAQAQVVFAHDLDGG